MDRRLPRSPALKSPVLSPKSPAIYEKYKSGCAWGLIHFFDFRQGHSHGKLISDKKRTNRQAKGDSNIRNRPNFLANEEKALYIDDAVDNKSLAVVSRKPEVNNVIQEEISVKHQTQKKRTIVEIQKQELNPKVVGRSKEHRKASKSSKKSGHFSTRDCGAATEGYRVPSDKNMVDKSSNNNLASVTEASGSDVHATNGENYSSKSNGVRKHDHHTEINFRVNMNEAVETFVNQKLTDGVNLSTDEVANRSKNFIDALEILNSNKELFMKLLHDPNSLLRKHIQDLRDSQEKKQQPPSSSKGKTSYCQPKEAGEHEGTIHAQMLESSDRCLSMGTHMAQALNTVVLKTSIENCHDRISKWPSPESHYRLRKKEGILKPAFLSFEHMKRKLRHAMRVNKKEQCQMSRDGINKSLSDIKKFEDGYKEMSKLENERISASKRYLDVGKMSESSHEANGRDGRGCPTENSASRIGNKGASSIQRELSPIPLRPLKGKVPHRKQFSDTINGRNEDLSRQMTLRTLDRIMSLPEYDLLPTLTPVRDKEHGRVQMRFSPYSNVSTDNGYKWRVEKEKKSGCLFSTPPKNLGAQPVFHNEKPDDQLHGAKQSLPGDLSPATEVLQNVYSPGYDWNHKVNQTTVCPGKVMERNYANKSAEHEANPLEVSLEANGVQNTNINQRTEAVHIFGESEYYECSKLILLSDQTPSSSGDTYSSSPTHIQNTEDSDSISDRTEQPSPISVLEQFFTEDNISSPSTGSLAAEPQVESFCIDIEELYASSLLESHFDLKSNAGTSMDKRESFSKCIRTVLQISGVNWDELSRKWHLSDQMLDSSLFDNVEVWPEKSCIDHRLLLGYINEVLMEMHQSYFRCSPWISLINPRPQPAILSKSIVHEVLRHVDWLLLSELPQRTLHQLVEKDLDKSGSWMDILLDSEEVVTELADCIVEDLVIDAAIWLQT